MPLKQPDRSRLTFVTFGQLQAIMDVLRQFHADMLVLRLEVGETVRGVLVTYLMVPGLVVLLDDEGDPIFLNHHKDLMDKLADISLSTEVEITLTERRSRRYFYDVRELQPAE